MSISLFRLRLVIGVVGIPALIAAGSVGLMASWLSTLPALVAVHWGPDGVGYGSPDVYLFLVGGIAFLMCTIFGVILLATTRSLRVSVMQKVIGVAPIVETALVSGIAVVTLDAQRGAASSIAIANPAARIVAVVLATGILTAAVWFVFPKAATPSTGVSGEAIHPLAIGPSEKIVWIRRVVSPAWLWVLFISVSILLFAGAVLAIAEAGLSYWWIFLLPVTVVLALATTLVWLVQIDADGLRVHSTLGFPRFRLPLEQIDKAAVVQVAALTDFGGWGVRWVPPRRFGLIVRSGEALEVFRKDGRSFVVTVDDAESAASALAGLVARENASSS